MSATPGLLLSLSDCTQTCSCTYLIDSLPDSLHSYSCIHAVLNCEHKHLIMMLVGDVGIQPDSGQYRLSGEVAGVEVNELRKTLGVRPTPYSVGGAVRGVLHVTGPLDQPVFSGTPPPAPVTV